MPGPARSRRRTTPLPVTVLVAVLATLPLPTALLPATPPPTAPPPAAPLPMLPGASVTSSVPEPVTAVRPAADAGCPGQAVPPGPPAQEEQAAPVPPLPVPAEPVGGPGMGTCTDAHAAGVPAPPPVGVASYVVADLDSRAVLAVRAPHARQRPASVLKLFTALVATARLDPAQVVTATAEDANIEGSRAGVGPGGRYTVEQLLTGLLLDSGNDTASALARTLGGVPATLAAIQDTARSLGARDTRPATPSGLDGPGMSSSAYDLALAFRAAVARPWIARLMLTRNAPFPGFADKPGFLIANDNPLLGTPGVIGGKTGFTDAARHTFAGAVQRGGRRLVVVLMRGEQRPVRMADSARALLDWGFTVPRTAAPVGELVEPATPARSGTGAAPSGAGPAGAPAGPVTPGAPGVGAVPEGGAPDTDGPGAATVTAVAATAVLAVVAVTGAALLRRRNRRR